MVLSKLEEKSNMAELELLDHHPDQQIQIICDDLLIEIFLWLPFRSIFKFKCLSHKWNHLLSNQLFCSDYKSLRKKQLKDSLLPLLGLFRCSDPSLDVVVGRTCFIPTCLESMSIRSREFVNKLGYCFALSNGVLLCGDNRNNYFVCNPIKDRWVKLPPAFNTEFDHKKYGLIGFLYEEDEDKGGFSYTVVRVDCSRRPGYVNLIMEIETYNCSSSYVNYGFWEKHILFGAAEFFLSETEGCQVVGCTFFWTAVLNRNNNASIFVAYKYTFCSTTRSPFVWLIQFDGARIGSPLLGESTDKAGKLLCIINKCVCIQIYTLKKKLESYSYFSVVPMSEWVPTVVLNVGIKFYPPSCVIAIHPQNSRFVLMRSSDSTVYWYDLELGESRSMWRLGVPMSRLFEEWLPLYQPQCWPPLL